jgi:F420H(2)-dependent biliverdin reductase
MPLDIHHLPERTAALLQEPAFAGLTTVRPDGRPHTALVGFSFDADSATCWLILRGSGVKYRNIVAAGGASGGAAPVTLSQHGIGGRWITFEGTLRLVPGPDALAETLRRYRARYGNQIGDDPTRVCAILDISTVYGTG